MSASRKLKGWIAAGVVVAVLAPAAAAEAPGPGSKQCSPGQNGNPQPGFKVPTCPGGGK